ncbi:MAG: chemotaxis protein CheD [Spirochaetota bacterium]
MSINLITVGIAEIQTATPPDILRTILGSCVGICLFDYKNFIGGLSHIMLPKMSDNNSNEKKYADTAIPLLLQQMYCKGAKLEYIIAKIVGGATMFNFPQKSNLTNIGERNIHSVKSTLKNFKIKIVAEELGGDYARTIDFYVDTGIVKIKYLNKQLNII